MCYWALQGDFGGSQELADEGQFVAFGFVDPIFLPVFVNHAGSFCLVKGLNVVSIVRVGDGINHLHLFECLTKGTAVPNQITLVHL